MIDCTDEQLIEEVRRRGFVIRDAQIGRKWIGLTEYQRLKFADGMHIPLEAVEKIEAKLKEMNGE